ncbi:MAG: hypothetical protein AAFO94_20335 [Bacteroidota bacterium]
MNILFLNLAIPKAMLLTLLPSYLLGGFVTTLAVIWLVAFGLDRRRKEKGFQNPLSLYDNEYADDRFLGI